MKEDRVSSGIPALDEVIQKLRLGDNVVWQVDGLGDYAFFARPLIERALAQGRTCVYLRFAPHPPVLRPEPPLVVAEVDPGQGFDSFCARLHGVLRERGRETFYVFDNLSSLVEEWASDEQLANFFRVTCPYLAELDTIAYFALLRGRHDHSAIARIRDTTQLLIDVYRVKGEMYIHPLKVEGRYSPQMFLPHYVREGTWTPVLHSGEAAVVSATARVAPQRVIASSIAPWDSVYRKLIEFEQSGRAVPENEPEVAALKQELCRMLMGSHPEFNRLADRYLTLNDLFSVRNRMIGSGRIGGKAAGMQLARRILLRDYGEIDFWQVLEENDSFFVGSDVFFSFLVNNDLFRTRMQMSRSGEVSRQDFEDVEQRFLAGRFPPEIMEQFREMLDYFGQAPIIVRSSSLLEDSFGNAFAGKYRSEFRPNQGSPERRLEALLAAVKLIFASTLNPDAITYRRRRGLGENDEQMALLVQRVSGMPWGRCFFPSLAGVAFSRNLYAWSDRIDPARGVIRLVFGLGTRAVNRVGGDYPRMISVSHPELRPEAGTRIAKYSQHQADVLDLEANEFVSRPIGELLAGCDYPNLHLIASVMRDGFLQDPSSSLLECAGGDLVLTFNNFIAHTDFVKVMGEILARLEKAYGHPVDVEFTASVGRENRVRINLLQCRPMWIPGASGPVALPEKLAPDKVLFRASRLISGGVVRDIRYIVYVDPRRYAAMTDATARKSLGRIVGRINRLAAIADGKAIMMGPGRWGSSNIALGVNVGYADIDNAAVLVELACEDAGHLPEVSYGTHFFQDLVEAQIIYLPVYPDDPKAQFNTEFFASVPSVLGELLPEGERLREVLRVLDVQRATGLRAHVVADAATRSAICYLQ